MRSTEKKRFLAAVLLMLSFTAACGGGGEGPSGAVTGPVVESGGEALPEALPDLGSVPENNGEASSGTVTDSASTPVENGGDKTFNGAAQLAWDAPAGRVDGSPLPDPAGYKVYYGTASGVYTETIDVGNVPGILVSLIQPGTYYFTVSAYDSLGNESGYSNEVIKTI